MVTDIQIDWFWGMCVWSRKVDELRNYISTYLSSFLIVEEAIQIMKCYYPNQWCGMLSSLASVVL